MVRVIRQPRGNMLLVGVGGSGRQSLSRLAAYILEYSVFQIEVTRHYRLQEFREDLQKLYFQAGVENKPSVFLFTDTQVVEESFLEDINNIFSSGEVPNLYKPDEFEEVSMTTLSYYVYYMYIVTASAMICTCFDDEMPRVSLVMPVRSF